MRVRIYALRDKNATYFNRLDLFENDLIALREYTLMLERQRMDISNYDILNLGVVNNTDITPLIEPCILSVSVDSVVKQVNSNIKEFEKYAKGL